MALPPPPDDPADGLLNAADSFEAFARDLHAAPEEELLPDMEALATGLHRLQHLVRACIDEAQTLSTSRGPTTPRDRAATGAFTRASANAAAATAHLARAFEASGLAYEVGARSDPQAVALRHRADLLGHEALARLDVDLHNIISTLRADAAAMDTPSPTPPASFGVVQGATRDPAVALAAATRSPRLATHPSAAPAPAAATAPLATVLPFRHR